MPNVKVEHINPFIKATMESFETMVNTPVAPGKAKLKNDTKVSHDISGIIGISGDAKGAISISFPEDVAVDVVSRFIGEKISGMGPEVTDAVGELANIIAGAAKKYLTDFNIGISLPTVVTGRGHSIYDAPDVLSMLIPFTYEDKTFDLGVALKSQN